MIALAGTAWLVALGHLRADSDPVQQLRTTKSCPQCNLEGAQLSGFQLDSADLSGANLANAQLYGTNLRNANLAGAIFQGANLQLADLTGAKDAALAGANTDERTTCPDGTHGPCQ